MGNIEVVRRPSRNRSADARGFAWEDWSINLAGEEIVHVPDFSAPGVIAHMQLRAGLTGTFDGSDFAVSVRSSLFRRGRHVRLSSEERILTFSCHGVFRHKLTGDDGQMLATGWGDHWRILRLDKETLGAVGFFALGGLDHFLDNPILRNL
ncbi:MULTISPECIES: hypothetical protein [unclassified Streptomyces]|uniref:hypothetical protein n=1 Tax=unclassified Streptomyces TaxID=2593676 RepID=UPI00166078FD|nr:MULTISPECIES: hypothetical protein [unclassified Streptomyces]